MAAVKRSILSPLVALVLVLTSLAPAFAQSFISSGKQATVSAASGCVIIQTQRLGGASITLGGTFTGLTAAIEVNNRDDSTVANCSTGNGWSSKTFTPSGGGSAVSSLSTTGTWDGSISGYLLLRVRVSALSTGSVTVTIATGQGGGSGGSGGGGTTFDGVLKDATGGDDVTDTANNAVRVNVVAGGAAGGTSSTVGAAVPGTATAAGASDGTNMRIPRLFDGDTGAGTDYVLGAILRKTASGGTVEAGTSTDPLRVDPTGTTTQPVSLASVPSHAVTNAGTFAVQAAQSGTWTVQPGNTANTTAWLVAGGKTNNNAAPGATNLGALVGIANAAAPTWTEGNQVGMSFDLSGNARVTGAVSCSNCTGTGASKVDGSTFTLGTDSVAPLGGYVDETAPTAATEDRMSAARLTTQRGLHVNPRDAAGAQLLGTAAAAADGVANPTLGFLQTINSVFNGTTWDRVRSVTNGQNTTGTGIPAAGMLGQLDDTSTGAVTENQFAPFRLSTRRAMLVEGVASGTAIGIDSELPAAAAAADGAANPTAPFVVSANTLWNGTTWDRWPGSSSLGATVNTEMPAAAAAADGAANPTAPFVQSAPSLWNGTTWDRWPGSTANGATVNTEMPAAAALANGTANPTVPAVGAFLMGYNGSTWDRVNIPQSACDDPSKVTTVNVSMTAATGAIEIVSLTSSQVVYVCGYSLFAGGDADITAVYGTGTNCGTGTTTISTVLSTSTTIGYGVSVSNGGAVQFKNIASNALCLSRSASVTLKGFVAYVKQ